MIGILDLKMDPRSLGDTLLLVRVSKYFEYQDGVKTDKVAGYTYTVAVPEKDLRKLYVKIEGKQLMESPKEYVEVEFDGLEIGIYRKDAAYRISAKAKGIRPVE